ncbi:Ubiquitin carboxyl-terminal hydrolase 12 [Abeliophyllum distichum]|uniref:ubiquitinyl hydrolase 1 n=1 Tax=Abeliophyllum distichum TaxID=126358 RepID=A0ABD1VWD3_9LAMI
MHYVQFVELNGGGKNYLLCEHLIWLFDILFSESRFHNSSEIYLVDDVHAGSSNAGGNHSVKELHTSRFTWRIENFSRLNVKKIYSEIFVIGDYKWRILVFPKGNCNDCLSVYLDVPDSVGLLHGWSRYAQFNIAVINQIQTRYTVRKDTQHNFNARESDWGFTSLIPLTELHDPNIGFLVNDTCIVEAEVSVHITVSRLSYDSKKETGFVGLNNQGATCYLNSLLQTLYNLPYFRKAVCYTLTTEIDMPSGSIPLALHNLFCELQSSDNAVTTKEFMEAFGWITYNSFSQHDVQEFIRTLFEKLEEKMKGTLVEGTLQKLFEGHNMDFIECINVNYKSTRRGLFYDLQLDVKGCHDVYAALDKYVEEECLEGDNKYHAGSNGLQDAKKGFLFISFPPILQLHLKRFEYDFIRDTMVKLNDYFEFPLQLDLDIKDFKYLLPEAKRGFRNLYTLHSVLVHSGGVHGGQYCAFIRPNLSHQWYKFDNERVTTVDAKEALEEQYGSKELMQTNPGLNDSQKCSNAYMLVYIRESEGEKIMYNSEGQKEQKKKDEAYMTVKVAHDEDIKQQIGRDLYLDLVDHDKVKSFHIQRQTPFEFLKEKVASEFGVPVKCQRFWLWAKHQNHTRRLNGPLTHVEEAQSVGQLTEASNKASDEELKLFLEVELGPDLRPILPPKKTEDDILLFFKLYDPEREELSYVGRLFVKSISKLTEIFTKLNVMVGYAPDEEIELYEEMKFGPNFVCVRMDPNSTFQSTKLVDGNIVCFQRCLPFGCHLKYQNEVASVEKDDLQNYLLLVSNMDLCLITKNNAVFDALATVATFDWDA